MSRTMLRAHQNEDLELRGAAQAGLPSQSDKPLSSGDASIDDVSSALVQDAHGQKQEEDDAQPAAPKRTKFADVGFPRLSQGFLPKTPKLSDDASKRQMNEVTDQHRSVFA